jgi:hypothetical protein
VARIFDSIPTPEEPPLSVAQIAARIAQGYDGLPPEQLELVTTTVLVILSTFNVLSEQSGRYRCRGEMPAYFTRSVARYISSNQQILDNWTRLGVGNDVSMDAILDAAPYLLRLMEDKRLRTSGPNAEPVRVRPVACVLIKTVVNGRAHYLFEWDRIAAQYQIIGGYIDQGEDPMSAAAQELIEEVVIEPSQLLEQGRHFDLVPLDWEMPLPVEWNGVSRTVGALTRYQLWVYGVRMKMGRLTPRDGDCRWLTTDEMLAGRTRSGRRTDNPIFYHLMNASLAGGLAAVPVSIGGEAVEGLGAGTDPVPARPPAVFVGHGHSPVWRELAEHLRELHGYRIVAFDLGPHAGQATSDVLKDMMDEASFAILVHTSEDEQASGEVRARQNVVHETGLFQGRLGFTRTIVIRERGCETFTNLTGLQELHYTSKIKEVFGAVVATLRREFG